MTYVGELGWELLVPTEFAQGVFDAIMDVGKQFDLFVTQLFRGCLDTQCCVF
jgi:glycine cleavage system aminomethyltransferase T